MQRFWDKVKVGASNECWEWMACRTKGYGRFGLAGRFLQAHRVAYELSFGTVAPGLFVMHTCDNPPCCNPAHLVAGTPNDNMQDKVRKKRHYHGDGHNKTPFVTADILRIREQSLFGAKTVDIASVCGVTFQAIRAIVRRKAWKHV